MTCRVFQLGAEETSIRSSGPVRSMAAMISVILPLKWKGRQRRKWRDMPMFLEKDTKS